jgi:hypothetical protein
MERTYQVTIHGRKLESCDLRLLLARAVTEKRNMDRRIRLLLRPPISKLIGLSPDFQHMAG